MTLSVGQPLFTLLAAPFPSVAKCQNYPRALGQDAFCPKFGANDSEHQKTLEQTLLSSARWENPETICRSINRLDKITIRDPINGYTPLMAFLNRNGIELLSEREIYPIVRGFIDRKVDVNAISRDGLTALMIAADVGWPSVVSALIKAGADPNIRVDGTSPLLIAAEQGHWNLVRLLLAWDADVSIDDLEKTITGKSLADHFAEHGLVLCQPKHKQVCN